MKFEDLSPFLQAVSIHGHRRECWGWGSCAVHPDRFNACSRCGAKAPHHFHTGDGSVLHKCSPCAFRDHLESCPIADRIPDPDGQPTLDL